jgi:hypothetical protein
MNDEVLFFPRSFCDKDTENTIDFASYDGETNGYTSGSRANAVDRNNSTYAVTSGKNTDGTDAIFVVAFGATVNIDTIFLKGNLKTNQIYFKYHNGSSWSFSIALDANSVNDGFYFKLPVVIPAVAFLIGCTHTIVANQEKIIYELIFSKLLASLPVSDMANARVARKRLVTENLKGGSIQLVTFPQNPKFCCTLNCKGLTTDFDAFEDLKEAFALDSCHVYFYYSDDIGPIEKAVYLMNDISDENINPASSVLANGVNSSLELVET